MPLPLPTTMAGCLLPLTVVDYDVVCLLYRFLPIGLNHKSPPTMGEYCSSKLPSPSHAHTHPPP